MQRARTHLVSITFALLPLTVVQPCSSVAVPPTKGAKTDPTVEIAWQLQDADEVIRRKAVDAIAERMRAHPGACAIPLAYRWSKPLRAAGYNKELADWSLAALLGTRAEPEEAVVEFLLEARVRALLALGKNAEALDAARSLYDVIRFERAPLATQLLSKCLVADPKTAPLAESFAGGHPGDKAENLSAAEVIKSIRVDSDRYQQWIDLEKGETFVSLYRRGNRLLIADKPLEARREFEASLKLATNPHQIATVHGRIARTFRAEDGAFGRELAYAAAHPSSSTQQDDRN